MKYKQNKFLFDFKKIDREEWCSNINVKEIEVNFCINETYFIDNNVDWERVQYFTTHFIENFDFIFNTTKKWAILLYNSYGDSLEQTNRFEIDNCRFTNQLFVSLIKPIGMPYNNPIEDYSVNNVFENPFTYLNSDCVFSHGDKTRLVGINASVIQDRY